MMLQDGRASAAAAKAGVSLVVGSVEKMGESTQDENGGTGFTLIVSMLKKGTEKKSWRADPQDPRVVCVLFIKKFFRENLSLWV